MIHGFSPNEIINHNSYSDIFTIYLTIENLFICNNIPLILYLSHYNKIVYCLSNFKIIL